MGIRLAAVLIDAAAEGLRRGKKLDMDFESDDGLIFSKNLGRKHGGCGHIFESILASGGANLTACFGLIEAHLPDGTIFLPRQQTLQPLAEAPKSKENRRLALVKCS
jgi:hypothetical protein